MTTRTDYHSILELKKVFKPETCGFVTKREAALIRETLELDTRSDIELQNIRDMVVMLYGQMFAEHARSKQGHDEAGSYLDARSAITHVIDSVKLQRGLEI